jgi:predicted NAD/FAD-binding protein
MIRDITRFNRRALEVARADPSLTIGAFLDRMGTGVWFRDYYLLPLSGAIWSTPMQKIMDFPAHAMMQFFENHALLNYTGQHQWYTVEGGSIEYVRRLEAAMRARGVEIRTGAPVQAVTRKAGSVQIKLRDQEWESFDEVVFATHSDDSLAMLADATPEERAALGAIRYQPNDVVLHRDPSVMPRRRRVWSSWNYVEDASGGSDRIDLTYWINSLQPVPMDDPHFVTLNTRREIRQELIYDQTVLRHPVYDLEALDGQERVREMNGTDGTWFCGAWMRHGFHEDGLNSAVEVVEAMSDRNAAQMAAE